MHDLCGLGPIRLIRWLGVFGVQPEDLQRSWECNCQYSSASAGWGALNNVLAIAKMVVQDGSGTHDPVGSELTHAMYHFGTTFHASRGRWVCIPRSLIKGSVSKCLSLLCKVALGFKVRSRHCGDWPIHPIFPNFSTMRGSHVVTLLAFMQQIGLPAEPNDFATCPALWRCGMLQYHSYFEGIQLVDITSCMDNKSGD